MKKETTCIFILSIFFVAMFPKITYSQHLIGQWDGHLVTNDPSTGQKNTFWLKINFDNNSAYSDNCGYGENRGQIKFITESLLEIKWPDCGTETVSIELIGDNLNAVGSLRAISNGRVIPSKWDLTRKQANDLWEGQLITNDISVGKKQYYSLKIDFTNKTAFSDCYGYGKITGRIKRINSNLLEIEWPDCGLETVSIEIIGDNLNAVGSLRAISNGRTIPLEWKLKRLNKE
jgi:hypothetical protein